MDIFFSIFFIIIISCILVSMCRWCCRKMNTTPLQQYSTATVITVPHSANQHATPPYPVQGSAMPQPMIYGGPSVPVGMAPSMYPTQTPYPNTSNMGMPYPMQNNAPYPPGPPDSNARSVAPYPTNPGGSAQQNPPTYAEATGIYERQSAFNPNFK